MMANGFGGPVDPYFDSLLLSALRISLVTASSLGREAAQVSHVLSIETDALHAFGLANRLSTASAERFRVEVVIHAHGVWELQVTAMDASRVLIKDLLGAVREWLEDEGIESAVVQAGGRIRTMSA